MLDAQEFVNLVSHMHRHANGAPLIGNRAGDCLADPPGGIGAEFVPALIFKFFGGADQADIAFLDKIQKGHAAAHVLFLPH